MKLTSISVTNFRSITQAHKISLNRKTVLIGRNNEGKSNILKALELAMNLLQSHASEVSRKSNRYGLNVASAGGYKWSRDFPLSLQNRTSGTQTIIKLTFSLDIEEVGEFKSAIGSNLNGELPIQIAIGKTNTPTIKVVKQGTGSKQLNDKSNQIAAFVAKKISFNYIPAVRTEEKAADVVYSMVSQRLISLEKNNEYISALETIENLQKPLLVDLGAILQERLKEFLPNISEVRVEVSDSARRFALRRDIDIYVDDGNLTALSLKGDGVKSLAALSLLKNKAPDVGASIVAIEEPEAHLHPGAIHQLYKVLESISDENQVILTTHNPLFVDRENIKSNIVVDGGKAASARCIGQIRDLLGIKASDNLTNARYVLVVEGSEDALALNAILRHLSGRLKEHLDNHYLVIEPLNGSGNLSYRLSHLKTALCTYHCLLDDDDAGRRAFDRARSEELLTEKYLTFTTCQGSPQAEFEDCLNLENYRQRLITKFGVDLNQPNFRSNKKWSDRVENCFKNDGKPWDAKTETRVKYEVARSVSENPENALHERKRSSVDALVNALHGLVEPSLDK